MVVAEVKIKHFKVIILYSNPNSLTHLLQLKQMWDVSRVCLLRVFKEKKSNLEAVNTTKIRSKCNLTLQKPVSN